MFCCVCNQTLGMGGYMTPDANYPHYMMCEECWDLLQYLPQCQSEEIYQQIESRFSGMVLHPQTPVAIRELYRQADDAYWARKESEASYQQAQEHAVENLMLTTGGTFDGYKVVKYLDIISCEVVFKNSFLNSMTAGFEDFFRGLSFKEHEMSGAMSLIENGKAYVMRKFREKAVSIGANGVLGIDFETSFGTDVVKISVNGTAVVVDPLE